ncbi:MAG: phosphoenolpyruvate--protein phosphotransferase [Clostridiales bacterium]|nr:phosphoenolpyruvate--protein phosphotransferase [Clostridiales bacterium]
MKLGSAASPGIGLGKVLVIKNEELKIENLSIDDASVEINKLEEAIEISKQQLELIRDKAFTEFGIDKAEIFEAHLMLLKDPEVKKRTVSKITSDLSNAASAYHQVIEEFILIFESMDNEYMRERAADIKDVSDRVLRNMLNVSIVDLSILSEEVILVADDLTPSQTATMDKSKVIGFLTDIGGRTSHSAIMARSLEIPAVVGLKDITKSVVSGDIVAFDGDTGVVTINPSNETILNYEKQKEEQIQKKKALESIIGQASVTRDGVKVEIAGNIGTPNDIAGLLKNDAEGVGLYRTEFIYMDRETLPTEEEQYESYKKVLEAMNSKPVVIRTLDIGGDKEVSYLKFEHEMNPFLGYRAIRLCLDRTDIFKTQLRALLRASVYGNLKIMFPMISSLEELLDAKEMLEVCKEELTKEGIEYSNTFEVGMMIEVPSAAIISDILAKHVDFFSIGTNDLIQYTCAVDRMNQQISNLYNPFNPGVLRLIKMVIDNGHKEGLWVGMCGETAGDPRIIPILIGFGLDEFSMSPISILKARKLIRSLDASEMKLIADKVIQMGRADDIEAYVTESFSSIEN